MLEALETLRTPVVLWQSQICERHSNEQNECSILLILLYYWARFVKAVQLLIGIENRAFIGFPTYLPQNKRICSRMLVHRIHRIVTSKVKIKSVTAYSEWYRFQWIVWIKVGNLKMTKNYCIWVRFVRNSQRLFHEHRIVSRIRLTKIIFIWSTQNNNNKTYVFCSGSPTSETLS